MLLNLLTRRRETPVADAPTAPDPEPSTDEALMRFRTLGGATVELHEAQFAAKFSGKGAPFALEGPSYAIDGYTWRCTGCTSYSREGDTYHESGFRDLGEAREDANRHAAECRSMPPGQAGDELPAG